MAKDRLLEVRDRLAISVAWVVWSLLCCSNTALQRFRLRVVSISTLTDVFEASRCLVVVDDGPLLPCGGAGGASVQGAGVKRWCRLKLLSSASWMVVVQLLVNMGKEERAGETAFRSDDKLGGSFKTPQRSRGLCASGAFAGERRCVWTEKGQARGDVRSCRVLQEERKERGA